MRTRSCNGMSGFAFRKRASAVFAAVPAALSVVAPSPSPSPSPSISAMTPTIFVWAHIVPMRAPPALSSTTMLAMSKTFPATESGESCVRGAHIPNMLEAMYITPTCSGQPSMSARMCPEATTNANMIRGNTMTAQLKRPHQDEGKPSLTVRNSDRAAAKPVMICVRMNCTRLKPTSMSCPSNVAGLAFVSGRSRPPRLLRT
mmetsp:Transcript_43683/g.127128  ORF Transcript_43683/g.127128 Transcript_43683/m.127128 type:complete len:202 (+) Transcript_43683:526-1131(+)